MYDYFVEYGILDVTGWCGDGFVTVSEMQRRFIGGL